MRRLACIAFAVGFAFFASALSPAAACRCWVGNADTTDEERIETAEEALGQTYYAVIGTISSDNSTNSDESRQDKTFWVSDAAIIVTEKILNGNPPAEIHIPLGAGRGVYDGRISSNLLGTCPMSWRDGERNVWLLLQDDQGNPVLASSCAHSLVRKWLFPDFWEEEAE